MLLRCWTARELLNKLVTLQLKASDLSQNHGAGFGFGDVELQSWVTSAAINSMDDLKKLLAQSGSYRKLVVIICGSGTRRFLSHH